MPLPALPNRPSKLPLLYLGVAFAAGIAAASLTEVTPFALALMSLGLAIAALLFNSTRVGTVLILCAFAAAGGTTYRSEQTSVREDRIKLLYDSGTIPSGSPVEIEGVLSGRPEPAVEGEFLTIRTESLRYRETVRTVSGNVRLFVPYGLSGIGLALKHGSRVSASANLERDEEYLNPGVMRRPQILDQAGIDATGSVKSPLLVEHIADESVFMPAAWVFDRRAEFINTLREELSPAAAGIMTASLLGDRHFLDRETGEIFREGGTFHVLVISGLHITFLGGILLLIVRRSQLGRWAQFGITATVLWGYSIAVGADVPVVRAAVMFTVLLCGYALYRAGTLLNALGLSVIILLAWRPSDLFNASFHLTFVSVAAIAAIAYPVIEKMRLVGSWAPSTKEPFPPNVPDGFRRFCETLYWRDDAWQVESNRHLWRARLFKDPFAAGKYTSAVQTSLRYAVEGILVSLVVQLAMLPLLVVYFHRLPVVSIILNLWVGFFIAIESFAAVVAVTLSGAADLLAAPFFAITEALNWSMLALPRLLTGHWWSGVRMPAYEGAGRSVYVAYFMLITGMAYAVGRWDPFVQTLRPRGIKRAVMGASTALVILIAVIVLHPLSAPQPDRRLKIDFLDVGQGDAALVTFPDGRTMLVDGGGRVRFRQQTEEDGEPFEPDIRRLGESVVSEFLWYKGYSHIDHLVVTHADADHIQGLADVARNFSVGSLLVGRRPDEDVETRELDEALSKNAVPVYNVWSGDVLDTGEARVEVLSPHGENFWSFRSNNDNSIVLRITFGARTFLLTGDIESAAEAALLTSDASLAADVVKVPHHGSRTSSSAGLVARTGPAVAIISVGRHSRFGHPHPEVLERWRAIGAEVRTTGEKGTVSISTDGSDLVVSTFVP